MNLLKLYRREATQSGTSVLVMAVISGIAHGLLLGIITQAAATASSETLNFRYLLLFVAAFSIVIVGKRFALIRANQIAENAIHNIRLRITSKIRDAELLYLENMGKGELYTRITQDTNLISESAIIIINACQSAIMVLFCILYIAALSKTAFAITVLSVGAAILNYMLHQSTVSEELRETTKKESRFFDMLNQLLEGFKELKINRRKTGAFFGVFQTVAGETRDLKVKTGTRFVTELMFSQVFFYTLIAVILFILPRLERADAGLIIQITAAILFIIGPLNMVVGAIPIFARSSMAVENLYTLEERLDNAGEQSTQAPFHPGRYQSFSVITFENVMFHYYHRDKSPLFSVGPIDMTIRRGEVVFVVGGNGSGKSTLMKLLTGLYYPESGRISVDGKPVMRSDYPDYRELYSIIFTDFHLFDRLYGIDEYDEELIHRLLKQMELDRKTDFVDGAFTNIQLSTGQRKRMAMITALLEDKPVYVFDEWAADQDPTFREYFYNEQLKKMKESGKTIIAVSHDDRFFHYADRVLKMDFGRFVPFE